VAPYIEMPPDHDLSSIMSENVRGLPAFAGHLFDAGYSWEHLKRDMARVALCVEAIPNTTISDKQFLSTLNELPLM
jgi:hypothetical protein